MTNKELFALASLVNADRMQMEATNLGRENHGYAVAYDDSVNWPAKDALERELTERKIVEAMTTAEQGAYVSGYIHGQKGM